MKPSMPAANATVCPTCRCVFVVSEKSHVTGFYERMEPNHCPNCGAAFFKTALTGVTYSPSTTTTYTRTVSADE